MDGLGRFVDDVSLIPDRPIQVAAVDGRDLDPESGVYHPETGITTYTLWGEIAYQIGGIEGYQLLRGADEKPHQSRHFRHRTTHWPGTKR